MFFKQNIAQLAVAGLMTIASATALAATTSYFVITPASPVYDNNNTVGATGAAPGYPLSSIASNGVAKTDMYLTPEVLFGRQVTVGEIDVISYWTKKGTTHAIDPRDWFLNIYTKPYAGQAGGGWYGTRIGTEPYYAINIADPANTWNQWSTDSAANQLRFFESTYSGFGSYADPTFDAFIAGTSLAGARGPGVPYATQPILFFSPQTASGWAAGFTGQLDGLSIMLTDGSAAHVNFEATDRGAVNKDSCKNDGWKTAHRADFTAFKNQGDCIQYANTGK